jgi:hypothetical protein
MMAVWKQEPIICEPPMEQWSFFQFPYMVSLQRIDAINLPNLSELSLDSQASLIEFPWQDIPNLQYINLYYCGFVELPLWKIPGLTNCYCYDNYNLTSVDAHGQTNLTSLDVSYSTALTTLNLTGCTGLNTLYLIGSSLLTELDISTCSALASLNLNSCDGITSLVTSSCPSLNRLSLYYCDGFTALDISNHVPLENLYLYRCESLGDVNLVGCASLDYISIRYCPLDQAAVDQILSDVVGNGLNNGYLRIDGTGTAAPSNPDGLALKATLISRGWTVYTN